MMTNELERSLQSGNLDVKDELGAVFPQLKHNLKEESSRLSVVVGRECW